MAKIKIPLLAYPGAFAAAVVAGRFVSGAGGAGPADDGSGAAADGTSGAAAGGAAADDGWGGFDSSGTQFPAGDGGGLLQTPIDTPNTVTGSTPDPGSTPTGDTGSTPTGDTGSTPTTTAQVAYLFATWGPGEVATYTWCKKNGVRGSKRDGSFTTKGFTAVVKLLGTYPQCDGTGNRTVYLITDNPHVGKIVRRNEMKSLVTRYR